MKHVQICADANGGSYIAEGSWPLKKGNFTPPSPAGYSVTDTLGATGVLMMHHPDGYRDEWHCAPAPVLGTVLTGAVCIQTSDGDSRILSPGDRFVASDLTGQGHKMQGVEGAAYDLMLVVLAAGPDTPSGGGVT